MTEVLKSMLRPALTAGEGKTLVIADWSAIEGRVNPWLSDTDEGEDKLQQYREGLDPYKVNAAATYGITYEQVTKDQRQVGKIQELALGYMGGAGSFAKFCGAYKLTMSDAEVSSAINGWRTANPWAQMHGRALERAYNTAMRQPGKEITACRTAYYFDGQHLWYSLPSGRVLCYPFAKVDEDGVSYAKASFKPASGAKEWPRARLWPGLAIENLTQAAANDLLRYALRELDDLYYDIVLHVHDEIVLEVEDDKVEQAKQDMQNIMTTSPAWAKGLPLEIEVSTAKRYTK